VTYLGTVEMRKKGEVFWKAQTEVERRARVVRVTEAMVVVWGA
jgi:hypothetical protein